ncbi:hypothetical protein [Deinococcus sp.]|uniref:hypothetical protein n=1 Tax=Deinococcus sp. TaxID=47478 RepID=UPI0025EE2B27|nr:hypothetical protein [Deinococcus sp.]
MNTPRILAFSVLLSGFLSACGGSAPATGGDGGGGGTPSAGTTVTRAQIAGCTPLSTSSDPAASNCLKGKFVGKTLGSDECSLTIGDNGSYQYVSPSLNSSVVPSAQAIRVFTYEKTITLAIWLINDSGKDLSFKYNGSQDSKASIEVRVGTNVSTCNAQL